MLAGRRPFHCGTAAATAAAILHDEPQDLASLGISVSSETGDVLRHCLEKKREERFQSARDCAAALRALLTDSDVPPTRAPRKQKQRRARKALDSLAVLPLFNASDDADVEYLGDGIT